jgi:uncharacterized protein YjiS (DUF1127 family)
MSTTFYTPATNRLRSQGSGLVATVKTWWKSYLVRRIEQAAIIQLHTMSDRELQDIGLARSQIEQAVRGELDPFNPPLLTGAQQLASPRPPLRDRRLLPVRRASFRLEVCAKKIDQGTQRSQVLASAWVI